MNEQQQVEQAAAAAWPASHTATVDGWLLRRSSGVPRRRSNSALPPGPERRPESTLEAVEEFYRSAGLPVTIQVSPAEQHPALDAALAARGYRHEAPTLVLTAPLRPSAASAPDPAAAPGGVVLEAAAGPEWLAAYQELNGPGDTSAVAELVLARVPAPAVFARLPVAGRDVAIGLFVTAGPWAGIFCMATHPDHRRRGLARTVLRAGTAWAAARGCTRAYLQVEQDTIAARELYARAGFTRSHSYHYRVSDSPETGHH